MKPPGSLLNTPFSPILLPRTPAISLVSHRVSGLTLNLKSLCRRRLQASCSSEISDANAVLSLNSLDEGNEAFKLKPENELLQFEVRSPAIPACILPISKFSLSDQVFILLAFIGFTTSAAFTSFVFVAVPTLLAMRRAAISFAKLADTAHEELPSTMAAVRLSGMEFSDLTLELSDLSQEIADGVSKSAQVVQAAEAGIRQIGSVTHQQTMSMIEERASLPVISLQPVVAGAAKKTSHAFGQATKAFLNIISRGEHNSIGENGNSSDRIGS